MDVQAWSGLTRLKEVTDGLGDRVVRFRNEAGRELLDLPDAPRPDRDTPAPVRFLPDYDNVTLSHADRSRIVDDGVRKRVMTVDAVVPGTFLVDGRVAGIWSLAEAERHGHPHGRAVRPARRRRPGRGRGGGPAARPLPGRHGRRPRRPARVSRRAAATRRRRWA